MKRIMVAVALAAALVPSSGHAEAALHPPYVSSGGGVIGTDSTCSVTVQVELFAHYIDRNGVVKNQVISTATSTCGGSVTPSQSTIIRLFNARTGAEVGTVKNCGAAVMCQRTDWIGGESTARFYAAGATVLALPAGTPAWIRCQDLNPPGGAWNAGYCSLRSDTKNAALSSYADWYLV